MRLICDISGLNEMQRKLIKAADPAKITRAVAQNTSEMQERAQDLCPVDTGTLKRSIGLEMRDGGKTGPFLPQRIIPNMSSWALDL